MIIEDLKKYNSFFKSADSMGAARILRKYLQIEVDFPVPLSLSHGVDMNHCQTAMDVNSIEPIHWSCNEDVHNRALKFKPSVKIPHPWLILKANRTTKSGSGTLVVGPPPGKSNDTSLLNCLKNLKLESYDLLLKDRGAVDLSRSFWENNNVKVVTAGPRDDFFYDRLFDLVENYEYVIGCTLSSALFFASSIGRKCQLIGDYTYSAYDTIDYLKVADFSSPVAKTFTKLLWSHDYAAASNLALDILGNNFLMDTQEVKSALCIAINELKYPVNFRKGLNGFEKRMILSISEYFNRAGLIKYGFRGYFCRGFNNKILLMKVNEIDIWLNGQNQNNFEIHEVKYIKGVTEPGWAVD